MRVNDDIIKDGLINSKVDPCGVCSSKVKDNSVCVCVISGKWVHGQCAREKMVTTNFKRNFACRTCKRNTGKEVKQEEK